MRKKRNRYHRQSLLIWTDINYSMQLTYKSSLARAMHLKSEIFYKQILFTLYKKEVKKSHNYVTKFKFDKEQMKFNRISNY